MLAGAGRRSLTAGSEWGVSVGERRVATHDTRRSPLADLAGGLGNKAARGLAEWSEPRAAPGPDGCRQDLHDPLLPRLGLSHLDASGQEDTPFQVRPRRRLDFSHNPILRLGRLAVEHLQRGEEDLALAAGRFGSQFLGEAGRTEEAQDGAGRVVPDGGEKFLPVLKAAELGQAGPPVAVLGLADERDRDARGPRPGAAGER